MARGWKKDSLPYVEFFIDEERPKYGRKFDQYYRARFMALGKKHVVCFGWMSAGWTPRGVYDKVLQYKENFKTGQGPTSWIEEQEQLREEAAIKKAERVAQFKSLKPFKNFCDEDYLPQAEASKKPESVRKEKEHIKNWLSPVVGEMPFKDIGLPEVKKIRANLKRKKRSARTQEYVFRTFSNTWGMAQDEGLTSARCPTKHGSFKLERVDNKKMRYLTDDEEDSLFASLQEKNQQAHDMALVALDTGLRFSKIADLIWKNVDQEGKVVNVLRTKGGRDRSVPMTKRLHERFQQLSLAQDTKPNRLVFPLSTGGKHTQIPSAFKRTVQDLGLNKDVVDPKLRFSFHVLRHTFASRLVQAGSDLHTVQVLLGHSTPAVTTRYSHLRQENLRAAVDAVERARMITDAKGKIIDMEKARKQQAEGIE